jgi:hypothetical protein
VSSVAELDASYVKSVPPLGDYQPAFRLAGIQPV